MPHDVSKKMTDDGQDTRAEFCLTQTAIILTNVVLEYGNVSTHHVSFFRFAGNYVLLISSWSIASFRMILATGV